MNNSGSKFGPTRSQDAMISVSVSNIRNATERVWLELNIEIFTLGTHICRIQEIHKQGTPVVTSTLKKYRFDKYLRHIRFKFKGTHARDFMVRLSQFFGIIQ
jgi:hypothetical protein